MLKYKLVLAGAKDVGKSSLIARYCDDIFSENMMQTIGVSFKSKRIRLSEKIKITVNIWDFGGEDKYKNMFPSYVSGTAAAVILYDTTRKDTLNEVKNWIDIVDKNSSKGAVIKVVIGTKIDLVDKREITREEVIKELLPYGIDVEVVETSAKTGENVEQAFINIAYEIVDKKLNTCAYCGEVFFKRLTACNYCNKPIKPDKDLEELPIQ